MWRNRRKYNNQPVELDGIKFPSKGHAERYATLKWMERQGEIADLRLEVELPLKGLNGWIVGKYRADFTYLRVGSGQPVIEEYKGYRTDVFELKHKLVEDNYRDHEFVVTGANVKRKRGKKRWKVAA